MSTGEGNKKKEPPNFLLDFGGPTKNRCGHNHSITHSTSIAVYHRKEQLLRFRDNSLVKNEKVIKHGFPPIKSGIA